LKFHKKANTDQKFTKNFNVVQNLFGKLQHAVAVRRRMGQGRGCGCVKAEIDCGCSSSPKRDLNSVENRGRKGLSVIQECTDGRDMSMGVTGNAWKMRRLRRGQVVQGIIFLWSCIIWSRMHL
jgi:hypothetical protein